MNICRAALAVAAFAAIAALSAGVLPPGIAPAAAQVKALTDAQDVNGVSGVVAEIVQCKRGDGMLSLRMRLRNTGDSDVKDFHLVANNYDQFYFVAQSKKYFVLRDTDRTPLATPYNSNSDVYITIPKGGSYTWYAKYPAPPDAVKKVSFYSPVTAPFEDIAISD
jgi:hypothetical protein